MKRHFFKLAVRNFSKNRAYVMFNIFGLTTAIATFILISLYVRHETTWDTFNENYERIFRLEPEVDLSNKDDMQYFTQTPWPAGKAFQEKYSEVANHVCLRETWGEYLAISRDQDPIHEERGYYTDNRVFDVFTFDFIAGNPEKALSEPNTVVLTESLANKYFPGENAVGRTLVADKKHTYRVTGIIEDPPSNFHLKASYFISAGSFKAKKGWDLVNDWKTYSSRVYILLKEHVDKEAFREKIKDFLNNYQEDHRSTLHIKELALLHLKPSRQGELLIILYLFGFSAIMILFLGAINFTNMTAVFMSTRNKELGIKKVMGSNRGRVVQELISESLMITTVALLLAITAVELVLPVFNRIVGRELNLVYAEQWPFILILTGVSFLMGFLAALHPAIRFSRFSPIEALSDKRQSSTKPARQRLSKILTTFQLFISIAFVLFALGTNRQVKHLINKDMGFNKENLLLTSIDATEDVKVNDWRTLRNELLNLPGVGNASISYHAPYNGSDGTFVNWEGSTGDQKLLFMKNYIGYHFVETYEMEIVEGRNFSPQMASDSSGCLINETAAKAIGWKDPIGKTLNDGSLHVIGVVKDYHKMTPFVEIMPQLLMLHKQDLEEHKMVSVRVSPDDFMGTLQQTRDKLGEFFPGIVINLRTMEDSIKNNQTTEVYRSLADAFTFFAVIAIAIALVGLFALVAFSARQRIKEIGIRKVMGATSTRIYMGMIWKYLKYYLIAAVLAVIADQMVTYTDPAASKPASDPLLIVITLAGALVVILMTISIQVIKTAHTNPVDSLRDE
jgi:putative ABC transport system permease protein